MKSGKTELANHQNRTVQTPMEVRKILPTWGNTCNIHLRFDNVIIGVIVYSFVPTDEIGGSNSEWGETAFSSSIDSRKQTKFLQTYCRLINAGMPTQQTQANLVTVFYTLHNSPKMFRKTPTDLWASAERNERQYFCHFYSKRKGNISLERYVAILPGSV